ncbi:acetylglutamate kinase [Faecalicatena contorta]|uniref:acetylglutamate kinase n=1 Tax=Faecalicatena fissicatena TaxID=290055 RepID=A0ABS2EBR8_9FIRM|nr:MULTISPECIES: acetylglutamate kinase [Faecalicatena]MBM6684951.1 acetylglutamate kinase [Faecalicatena contorta]MBM6710479.1 acetylglutamate kinase [Faecalicatena contorta]MBM6739073.1 acetylglutamate kinase [Faecalicatena fissicatena]HIX99652.1 acetylglutamate kinase [Candidatus Dorea intestinigallinarum]
MERMILEQVEKKAEVLTDALPYIRDFNRQVAVIEYGCRKYMSPVGEQELMRDIALLKTVGMKPVVVHGAPIGVDKFRENKRVAKLLELCGTKAIGICGMDMETPSIMLENGYIPVIMPNDIDTENVEIDPIDAALDVAVGLGADKLVYLSSHRGIWKDEERTEVYSRLTVAQVREMLSQGKVTEGVISRVERGLKAIERGVNRVNLLDGRMDHALLLEFFSVAGVGTVMIQDESRLYAHEKDE